MDKLIELLNEYKPNQWNKNLEPIGCDIYHMPCGDSIEHCIISNSYGFIDWLVENDKIDNSKFYDKNILKGFMTLTKEEKADSIIMNLSIQDNPLDFLVKILK